MYTHNEEWGRRKGEEKTGRGVVKRWEGWREAERLRQSERHTERMNKTEGQREPKIRWQDVKGLFPDPVFSVTNLRIKCEMPPNRNKQAMLCLLKMKQHFRLMLVSSWYRRRLSFRLTNLATV